MNVALRIPLSVSMNVSIAAWYFAHFAFVGLFVPFFPLYLDDKGLSVAQIGAVVAAGQAMRVLVPALWGWASDRSARRVPLVRGSAALSIVVFFAYFQVQGFWPLLIVTAMLYAAWSGAHPLVEALTFAQVRNAPARYGRIRLWGSVGFVVAVLGGGWWLDGRVIDVLMGLVLATLVFVLLAALTMRDVVAESSEPVRYRVTAAKADPLLSRAAMAVLLAAALMSIAHGPLYAFLSLHLGAAGFSRSEIGWLWALGVFAEIAVFIWQGAWMRRWRVRTILATCFMLTVLRFVLLADYTQVLWLVIVAQILHGASFGVHHVATASALNQWFPAHMQGRVQALYGSLSFGAGGMLGAYLGGLVWQGWGAGPTYWLAAVCALLGAVVVLAGIPAAAQEVR
jgi:MFS transporter, PPP family, 3-phenylpropionic acid transporter